MIPVMSARCAMGSVYALRVRLSAKWVHRVVSAVVEEPFGRRLARLRQRHRMTQQEVAMRLAVSRNAVSHIETGLSHPSERTVVLLGGLYRIEPHELVKGTDYPQAKADRLPLVAARFTAVEARLEGVGRELALIEHLPDGAAALALASLDAELADLEQRAVDPGERAQTAAVRTYVAEVVSRKRA